VLLVAGALWPGAWAGAVALLVLGLVAAPFVLPAAHFLLSLATTLAGALYPTGLLGALVLLREARGPTVDALTAFWIVLLTFFVVWATDIFAYYVGRAVGRRKLAPSISPNKTWEGALGGALGAVLIVVAFKLTVLPVLAWPHVGAVGLIGGVLGQIGDLTESQIKRSTDVKDASALLPGHGGLLDRFDSMVVAAPLIYLYLRWVAQLFG
jgi:phosphatidate cytidylyltransferase